MRQTDRDGNVASCLPPYLLGPVCHPNSCLAQVQSVIVGATASVSCPVVICKFVTLLSNLCVQLGQAIPGPLVVQRRVRADSHGRQWVV
jgi:hypothetical protein